MTNLETIQSTERKERKAARKAANRAKYDIQRFAPVAVKKAILDRNFDLAMNVLTTALTPGPVCVHCHRLYPGEEWAARIVFECAGAIGQSHNIVVQLNSQLGVSDLEEARALIAAGKQLNEMTNNASLSLEECRDNAIELLRSVLLRHPEWRSIVSERLALSVNGANGVAEPTG
jgi:hypothetical protein